MIVGDRGKRHPVLLRLHEEADPERRRMDGEILQDQDEETIPEIFSDFRMLAPFQAALRRAVHKEVHKKNADAIQENPRNQGQGQGGI